MSTICHVNLSGTYRWYIMPKIQRQKQTYDHVEIFGQCPWILSINSFFPKCQQLTSARSRASMKPLHLTIFTVSKESLSLFAVNPRSGRFFFVQLIAMKTPAHVAAATEWRSHRELLRRPPSGSCDKSMYYGTIVWVPSVPTCKSDSNVDDMGESKETRGKSFSICHFHASVA